MQVLVLMDVDHEMAHASVFVQPMGMSMYQSGTGLPSRPPEDTIAEAKNTIHALSDAVEFAERINRSNSMKPAE
jgi:hypothetical protein